MKKSQHWSEEIWALFSPIPPTGYGVLRHLEQTARMVPPLPGDHAEELPAQEAPVTDWQGEDKVDRAISGALAVVIVFGALMVVIGVWGFWK